MSASVKNSWTLLYYWHRINLARCGKVIKGENPGHGRKRVETRRKRNVNTKENGGQTWRKRSSVRKLPCIIFVFYVCLMYVSDSDMIPFTCW